VEDEWEGVRCINRLWSALFSSSLSSSEGASKASWRFRSSSLRLWLLSCEVRRELARERKDGGGESGTGMGVCAMASLWSSSASCAAICEGMESVSVMTVKSGHVTWTAGGDLRARSAGSSWLFVCEGVAQYSTERRRGMGLVKEDMRKVNVLYVFGSGVWCCWWRWLRTTSRVSASDN
jgi:hypothetical protein